MEVAVALTLMVIICAPPFLINYGIALTNQGKYDDAEGVYKLLLAFAKPVFAVLPVRPLADTVVNAQLNLSYVWCQSGRNFDKGVLTLKQAEQVCRKYNLERMRGMVMLNLSMALAQTDRLEEAAEYQHAAFDIFQAHRDVVNQALSYVTLSANNLRLGNVTEAEKWGTTALNLMRREEKQNDQTTEAILKALNNVAIANGYKYEWARAQEMFDEALALKKEKLAPNDPSIITALNNCAWAALKSGQLDAAERHLVEVDRLARGNQHMNPNVRIMLGINRGEMYRRRKDFEEADRVLTEMLPLSGASLEQTRAALYGELANLHRSKGESAEAERWYKDCLASWEKSEGPQHPKLAPVLLGYAKTLQTTSRTSDADAIVARANAIIALHKLDKAKVEATVD